MAEKDTVWIDLLDTAFEQKFYDVAGVRTRCLESGSGAPLMLLHGGGGHADTWVRNLGPHAPYRRSYAIDMLGHGFTDAPGDASYTTAEVIDHVVRFMDVAEIERADFCGESFGGRVSAWMAIRHPDRVNRLVLNTSGGLHPGSSDGGRRGPAGAHHRLAEPDEHRGCAGPHGVALRRSDAGP